MPSLHLDALSPKDPFKDVLVWLVDGDHLTLNYFGLKGGSVRIPLHEHPVEQLVVLLKGEVEFMFKDHRLSLKEIYGPFIPAKTRRST